MRNPFNLELPATLCADLDYEFDHDVEDSVPVVRLIFGVVPVKTWRISDAEHAEFQQDKHALQGFVATKLAALFEGE